MNVHAVQRDYDSTSSGVSVAELSAWLQRTTAGSGQTGSILICSPPTAVSPLSSEDQEEVPAGQTT
ncbi:MAG: hypothetical protein CVU59_08455, partial [Deltaproteobacteria bacterium HGW-Deltaproteobacteria-17]